MASLIPGTSNARDLGGLPLVGGGAVRAGVLLRSDALADVDEDGAALLADVGTVIDLRTAQEREGAPDALPGPVGPRVLERPLLEGAVSRLAPPAAGGAEQMAGAAAEGEGRQAAAEPAPEQLVALRAGIPTLAELYLSMLEHGAATFADCARAVAVPEDPQRPGVLIHCTAGKDRTGVAVALLLDAVGTRREAIVADYTRSQDELAGPWAERMLEGMRRAGIPPLPEIEQLACATPADAIEAVLEAVDARGGAAAYLREGGLSEQELTALRTNLRDDAADGQG
jgi:protein-tyrosine phosphatase